MWIVRMFLVGALVAAAVPVCAADENGQQGPEDFGNNLRGALYFNVRGEAGSTTLSPGGPQLRSALGGDAAWSLLKDLDLTASFYVALDEDNSEFDEETAQGAIGVQWRPFSNYKLALSLLRIVEIGDESREGWLTAASSYMATGADWNPGASEWPYAAFSGYASYLWDDPEFASASFDGRLGYAWVVAERWIAVPHVVMAGQYVDDSVSGSSLVEAGAGVLLRHWTCRDRFEGPRCAIEFYVQYRHPVTRDDLGNDDGTIVFGAIIGAF